MAEYLNEDADLLLKAFFKEKALVRQHLDSYNEFIDHGLQEIVDEVGEIPIEVPEMPYKVKLGQVWVIDPQTRISGPYTTEVDGTKHEIYPMEARLRNLTYAAPVALEMTPVVDGREQDTELVYIGNIPVMLKSKLCYLSQLSREELIACGEDPDDPGGYFIVNGSERVIVAMEDLAPNRIIVDVDDKGTTPVYQARVFSSTVGFRARIEMKLKSDGVLYVSMPGVPTEIPFVILMRALGLESDREIAEAVSLDGEIQGELEPSFEKAVGVDTSKEAILFIGNRVAHGQVEEYRIQKAETAIDKNLLPHLGRTSQSRKEKAIFLGEMACRIIELKLGRRKPDDKDHFKNKRLRLAGPLLADLFRVAFRNLVRDIKYQLERIGVKGPIITVSAAVRPGIITERLQHALATGNWGRGKVGVTQLLDRTNYLSTLSHLRRLQSPLSRSQPNFEARDLHPTHWGRLCPNETPEGSNCGLVKNLALSACISVGVNPERVKQILYSMGVASVYEANEAVKRLGAKVFVDGNLIGYCTSPEKVVEEFRQRRRKGEISSEVNIAYYPKLNGERDEIHVNCDEGRVRRPLIIVENGSPKLKHDHIERVANGEWTWEDLVKNGIIEYLDAEEEENAYIAISLDEVASEHTHAEIAAHTILGICASTIPYAEHNQSPRNSYQAAMAKQALGIYATNFPMRVDSRAHLLHYPQVPIVETKLMETIGYKLRPSGQNCIVAVLSFEGYNMEDALIFNKASIERGLARSTFYRIYEAECRQYMGGLKDKFMVPEPGIRGFRGEQYYRLLEPDGIIRLEAEVAGGDVLIGRVSPPRFLEEYKEFEVKGPSERDTSVEMRPSETGMVDAIFITESGEGSRLVKVRVRDQRIPELGDKFASRHGQKGVIGIIIPQEDMPFTEDGIVPDIIINPHAIPSRMTIGQFIESVAGKVAALRGSPVDGTPFSSEKPEDLKKALVELGFSHTGREVFYSGITGEKFVADVFVGVVYYQKLHHMVADKMHARARGQVQMLTRQPTEGRARGGGLRFGEMERDCLIGHGAAMLLHDRLLEESDKYTLYVCKNCGYIAYYDMKQRKYVCRVCEDKAKIAPVTVSYAFKLLLQEMMSLCIAPRLKLRERA
ncbi:MAG: DNA-directed RNA polymerase subunit B [Candidatus Bathyarchaeota archaeon]|nr:DNA-directed RNA polymerase subunit B [Candidatus Bathyarchaeota archaeon]MCX8177117.1 DNA-directed RNA polymerase subunit B [Candidatus Bathyarchaeota archaeon]MDW8193713.1 DNA-directed RNA polymerase subunit B [Nitrososphaerota archaeon]